MIAHSVIAIAIEKSLTFIPILSVDGMNFDECKSCINAITKVSPENIYTVVSGGTYEVSAHAKEYSW